MASNNKAFCTLAHPTLFVAGTIWMIIAEITIAVLTVPFVTKDDSAWFEIGLSVLVFAVYLMVLPQWHVSITFDHDNVRCKAAFHKATVRPYGNYYIFRASYFHGSLVGVGYTPVYIVFATHRLSTRELNQINQVQNSDEIIKIRYSKKTLKRMLEVLPPQPRTRLAALFAKELEA